jgi:hypothetical protein
VSWTGAPSNGGSAAAVVIDTRNILDREAVMGLAAGLPPQRDLNC